jgi:carotenoid cleavage dioxygenase
VVRQSLGAHGLACRQARAGPAAAARRRRLAFNPAYGARIGVLPRYGQSADVRWFEIEPCYIFHTLNAYDAAADRVVLDALRYDTVFDWSDDHNGFLEEPLTT